MPPRRPASIALVAAALLPVGCIVPVPCDDPGGVCLATDDVSRVRIGVLPDALAVADLDGDGKPDLVGASGRAGTITVVWHGDTGFTGSATTWSIDQEVAGIVVADLDDDGVLDLATALPRADAVAVLRGQGNRSFTAPERHPAGALPRALIAADLDGAAPPELVAANLEDGTVTVLHRFVAAPAIVVGPGPRALAAGDLDSDGHLDVAVALADVDAVQVLRGDGERGLSPAALHPVGAAPYDLVVADLDADGHLDIATADSLDDSVSVLFGDGNGDLRGRTTWPTVPQPTDLVVAQPPGEAPVLGVLSETTSEIHRLDPRSGAALPGVLTGQPRSIADLGGVLVSAGRAVSHLYPGTGVRVTPLWLEEGLFFYRWFVDLDGDGADELLVWDFDPTEPESVMTRRDGETQQIAVGFEQPETIEAADLTGDGRPDLLVTNAGEFVVSVQRPDGSFAPGPVFDTPGRPALADIDADGVAEVLLVGSDAGEGRLDVYRSDGAGALTLAESSTFALEFQVDHVRAFDGDGDEFPDLMLTGAGAMVYLEDARTPAHALPLVAAYDQAFAFGDLDRDGRLDAIACGGPPRLLLDVLGLAESDSLTYDAPRCDTAELVDLDGDGDLDILTIEYRFDSASGSTHFTPFEQQGDQWLQRGSQGIPFGYTDAGFTQFDGSGPPEYFLWTEDGIHVMRVDFGPGLLEHEHTRLGLREDLRFADLDDDGAADMVAFGENIAVARADGSGGYEALTHLWTPTPPATPRLAAGLFADIAGDGAPQFAWTTHGCSNIGVATVAFDGLHEAVQVPAGLGGPYLFAGDVDRDGLVDLLAFDTDFRLSGALVRGRGDGEFAEPVPLALEDLAGSSVTLHDMNRDGDLDIVAVARYQSEDRGVRVWFGAGDGTFAPSERWSGYESLVVDPKPLVAGDFDRDGRVELVTINRGDDLLSLRGGDSVRVLRAGIAAYGSADLDRDGHPELLAAGSASEGHTRLHVGRSRSDGSFGFTTHDIATTGVRDIQTADVDGDGELDIILVDEFGGTIVRRVP